MKTWTHNHPNLVIVALCGLWLISAYLMGGAIESHEWLYAIPYAACVIIFGANIKKWRNRT